MDLRPFTYLELCAGVGGLGLGVELAVPGARCLAMVEREAYAAAILAARMGEGALAPAPIWSDLATFDARGLRARLDCVVSGDPCQPNSKAGKLERDADDRFLIGHVLRIVEECRPHRFFRENVTGNAAGQLEALVPPLERMGYRVACGVFSATEAGAPHPRERLFLMAGRSARPDAALARLEGRHRAGEAQRRDPDGHAPAPAWWTDEPAVGRVAHGVADRVDRLRAIGNGVVPLAAANAFLALDALLAGELAATGALVRRAA